jgi:dihydropteroate synthase
MGILNVTPDSFSDGGQFLDPVAAAERAHQMVEDGADVLDIGAESTRPGSHRVPEEEELRRILPVVSALARTISVPLSVDTMKASVAERALALGAVMVNDVSGLCADARMKSVVAASGAAVVIVHMQGTPDRMQLAPRYTDVVREVCEFLATQMESAIQSGISSEQMILDPGIGFGKMVEDNLALLNGLSQLHELKRPIMVGVSRKSFIGHLLGRPIDERVSGSLAAAAVALMHGASMIRVHDVAASRDLVMMIDAIRRDHRSAREGSRTDA